MSKFSKSFDGTVVDKTEYIKLEFFMNPDNPASGSKYSQNFDTFKVPRGVDHWLTVLMYFHDNENLMTLKEPANKTRMFRTLLKGQALSYSEHHLMRRLEAEDLELPLGKVSQIPCDACP
jgi:hypothetical protein